MASGELDVASVDGIMAQLKCRADELASREAEEWIKDAETK